MNKKVFFGYVMNAYAKEVRRANKKVFDEIVSSPLVAETYQKLVNLKEAKEKGQVDEETFKKEKSKLKAQLPAFLYQADCPTGVRKNSEAEPSMFCIIDIDHEKYPLEKWHVLADTLKELKLMEYVVLTHLTPSLEGLRLVLIRPENGNIKQAQAWWAKQLKLEEYDTSVNDLVRLSYAPLQENILYRNDALLFPSEEAVLPSLGEVELPVIEEVKKTAEKPAPTPKVQQPVEVKKGAPIDLARVEKNLGVKIPDIVARYWEKTGMPYEGSRNTRLADLAAQVRYVVDYNTEAVTEILRHALPTDVAPLEEAEYQSIARSMCKQERTPMSHLMREILNELKEEQPQDVEGILYPYFAPQPPAMPKRLPKCVYLICNGFEKIYWPAVANSIFPTLGSYCYDLSFDYLDGRTHEMHFMEILFGESGEGKNVITMTDKALSKRMDARDAANRAIIQQWKEETKNSSANSKKKPRPVVPIQRIAPDATGAGYLLQALAAGNLTLHLSLGELSLIRNLSGKNVYEFLCAAFDRDDWGATRAGIDSVDGMVSLRLNFSAACTIWKTLEFLKGHVADGTTSRIGFTYLVSQEIGADMPKLKKFDELFQKNLAPYLDALENTHGNLVCKPALRVAKEMNEEFKQVSVLTYDRAFNNLSRRANVIGYLKGCLLYVANGCKWEKEIEDFMRWSIRNDMWVKMRFFAEEFERETQMPNISRKGPKNLLTFLPDQFTEEEAIRTLSAQGKTEKNVENMLKQWKKRHHIREEKNSSDSKLYIKINSNVMTGK